jgi:DNA (cytosine-5)-methyltransferase 1
VRWASCFTGIGGFEVGGFQADTMVEIDPACRAVLARHYPHANIKEDIHDVKGTEIGRVDGLLGGFPCQDTSFATPNRTGLAGSRSSMYFEFIRLLDEYQRLIDELNPRFVVIENPVGLLTSPGRGADGTDRTGWDMAAVVRGLEDLGYGWAYRVVDGRYLGSTQKRERVIVVGHRGGDPRPAWQVLADDGPGEGQAHARTQRRGQGGPRAGGGTQAGDDTLIWRKSARARKKISAGGYETWVPAEYSNTLTGFDGGGPNRQTHIVLQDGKLRTFTLTEWERLQGFPDGWTEGHPDSVRYKMLGNAIHTGTASWLNNRIEAVNAALPQLEVVA